MKRLIFYIFCVGILANPFGKIFFLHASPAEPDARDHDAFDFMNLLSEMGLHDQKDERWNVYGQVTYISSWKGAFPAAYSNLNGTPNSLSPNAERSYTATATAYLGLKTWHGGEVYLVPEVIMMRPLSHLTGLGGAIQNFELQRNGAEAPFLYLSRAYFKQTINLGGSKVHVSSEPMQLGTTVDSHRLVFRVGNFSVLDFFDKNSFSGDLRRQFVNMSFLSYSAYDYASDGRGYTWGGVAEYIRDDWTLRFGHAAVPVDPNQLVIDSRIFKYYGEQFEIENRHEYFHQPGAVRLLMYRNSENSGRFEDAVTAYQNDPNQNATTCNGFNYKSPNATAPDVCWARKPNIKMGIGINFEQQVLDDFGIFMRGMYSDGNTEVYSYTSTDRSLSFGMVVKGKRWSRARDSFGIGYAAGWLSPEHIDYLNKGGVDGFIGDGKIAAASEQVLDIFYSLCAYKTIWISLDYQHVMNPAYNADRGPVDIIATRLRTEF